MFLSVILDFQIRISNEALFLETNKEKKIVVIELNY